MNKHLAIALLCVAPFALGSAQAADDKHPPQKAMESATPEMKNPGDRSGEHAPQKAMDSAVPAGSGGSGSASDGASPGSGGSTYNANDQQGR